MSTATLSDSICLLITSDGARLRQLPPDFQEVLGEALARLLWLPLSCLCKAFCVRVQFCALLQYPACSLVEVKEPARLGFSGDNVTFPKNRKVKIKLCVWCGVLPRARLRAFITHTLCDIIIIIIIIIYSLICFRLLGLLSKRSTCFVCLVLLSDACICFPRRRSLPSALNSVGHHRLVLLKIPVHITLHELEGHFCQRFQFGGDPRAGIPDYAAAHLLPDLLWQVVQYFLPAKVIYE